MAKQIWKVKGILPDGYAALVSKRGIDPND
jgi:hypothetical protein